MLAAERGRLEVVALLLERQADVTAQDSLVRVLMHHLAIGLVKEPLQNRHTALMLAASCLHLDVVRAIASHNPLAAASGNQVSE
jgi:ankyrin repeat protein